jgi:hypothetical protein
MCGIPTGKKGVMAAEGLAMQSETKCRGKFKKTVGALKP